MSDSRIKVRNLAIVVLVSLGFSLIYVFSVYQTFGEPGLPLDDAWIHLVFARNTAHGDLFAYNPHKFIMGTTSPLWVLLMVPAYWLDVRPEAWAYFWGWLFLALSGVVTYIFARRFMSEKFAVWGAVLVVSAGRLLYGSLSGMEVALATFLWILSAYLIWRVKTLGKGLFWTVCALAAAVYTRPESYLFAAVCLVYLLFDRVKSDGTDVFVMKFKYPLIIGIMFSLFVLPYPILCYISHGRLFPTTFYAKRYASGLNFSEYIIDAIGWFIGDNLIWGLLGLLAIVLSFLGHRFAREANLKVAPTIVFLWPVTFLVAEGATVTAVWHNARYIMPLIPFWILLAFWFAYILFERFKLDKSIVISLGRFGKRTITLSLIFFLLTFGLNFERAKRFLVGSYLPDIGGIRDINIAMGEIIKRVVPPNVTVAVNDIGAITYFGEHPIFDLIGIASPEVLPIVEETGYLGGHIYGERMMDVLKCKPEVGYMAVFPHWFPGMMDDRVFEPLYHSMGIVVGRTDLSERRINMQILYKIHRELLGPCKKAD